MAISFQSNPERESVVESTKTYRFKFNNIIPLVDKECKREGWDEEVGQYERCGFQFRKPSCTCHPDFCVYCCAEVHSIDLTLPGVLERTAIECMLREPKEGTNDE